MQVRRGVKVIEVTSRIARRKDSIRPADSPRAGAVCSSTAPMLLHEGYARWNIAVASAAARRRSNVRCEDLKVVNSIRNEQTNRIEGWAPARDAHEDIIAEVRRISAEAPTGTRENGLRRRRSSREDGSAMCWEYWKCERSKRADKGGNWLPVTATIDSITRSKGNGDTYR